MYKRPLPQAVDRQERILGHRIPCPNLPHQVLRPPIILLPSLSFSSPGAHLPLSPPPLNPHNLPTLATTPVHLSTEWLVKGFPVGIIIRNLFLLPCRGWEGGVRVMEECVEALWLRWLWWWRVCNEGVVCVCEICTGTELSLD